MGNFEKLVVLIVLFLSAVVLAVSLGDSEAEAGAGPVATAPTGTAEPEAGVAKQPVTRTPATKPSSIPLLDAGTRGPSSSAKGESDRAALESAAKTTAARQGTQDASGRARILKSVAGLSPSLVDDFMEYTVREGDTWAGLAQRFYHDARQVTALKVANDDPAELTPQMKILVPVYDFAREVVERERFAPAGSAAKSEVAGRRGSNRRDTAKPQPSTVAPVEPAATPGAPAPGSYYVVREGDNLSKIAYDAYGRASLWREIFVANEDRMERSDWLTIGMKLYIPKPGEHREEARELAAEQSAAAADDDVVEPVAEGGKVR